MAKHVCKYLRVTYRRVYNVASVWDTYINKTKTHTYKIILNHE